MQSSCTLISPNVYFFMSLAACTNILMQPLFVLSHVSSVLRLSYSGPSLSFIHDLTYIGLSTIALTYSPMKPVGTMVKNLVDHVLCPGFGHV